MLRTRIFCGQLFSSLFVPLISENVNYNSRIEFVFGSSSFEFELLKLFFNRDPFQFQDNIILSLLVGFLFNVHVENGAEIGI